MLEKTIQHKIMQFLKGMGWARKISANIYQSAGIPDILACVEGRFFAFEVKQPKGRLTDLQAYEIEQIKSAGGVAAVVTSVEDVQNILKKEGICF